MLEVFRSEIPVLSLITGLNREVEAAKVKLLLGRPAVLAKLALQSWVLLILVMTCYLAHVARSTTRSFSHPYQ
jgi:hypothetical protein